MKVCVCNFQGVVSSMCVDIGVFGGNMEFLLFVGRVLRGAIS